MRQLIAVALFCAGLFCIAQEPRAQVPMTGAGLGAPASGFTPSCSQSSTFLAAATGVTLTADKTNYDTMICGIVTDGNFSGLDVFYIFAAPTATNAALINIAKPGTFNGTVNGTCTFTAAQGYTGDGSTCFIDSGFNPTTASSPNFTQNSGTCGGYDRSNRTSSGNQDLMGSQNTCGVVPGQFGGTEGLVNGANMRATETTAQGAWNATRTAITSTAIYLNSNETAEVTGSSTSTAPVNQNIYVMAENITGSGAALFTTDQIAAAFIGAGLTAVNSCKVNNRINTFMTAYSTNIYTNSAC